MGKMSKTTQNEYEPDIVSPPGDTLLETLETVGMSQAELARRMGRPKKTINEIIQGKAAITAETALRLEQVLNISAAFWLKREQQYREAQARLSAKKELDSWVDWLKELPIKLMRERGWISEQKDKAMQVWEALKFFGVASPDAWRAIWEEETVAFRKSPAVASEFGAMATWLRQGEREAQEIDCKPFSKSAFQEALQQCRQLTIEPPEVFQERLTQLCAEAGVAVVFVEELPKTGICGATRWLTPNKALLQLSLRYKTDDHLWFTFFHEGGHILKHGKKDIFLEDTNTSQSEKEQEANEIAASLLISPTDWRHFTTAGGYFSKDRIREFATSIGIAPGIVVGRLQHEKRLPFTHCNELKRHFAWKIDEDH